VIRPGYFLNVPLDRERWQQSALSKYPLGIPDPYSDDPTQWLFHGHPRYAEPGTEVHVALARLAGYRWPAENDTEMRLSAEARARVAEAATLPEADADGLLALVPVLGERPLADRLRAYCAAAWGEAWAKGSEAGLIAAACARAKDKPPRQPTFEAWLSTRAARQHARLFHDRPFLWWITDGRSNGFTVVAHYHRLNRANLERLAYTMLGDWIGRLSDDPRGEAARILQQKLARILEGESPYDIFVRWKLLARQPLGWEPDLDDGVRLNIRPFVEAGVLGHVPNVKYSPPDRGNDVASAPWYHLFYGKRRNDHHTTLADKRAARAESRRVVVTRRPVFGDGSKPAAAANRQARQSGRASAAPLPKSIAAGLGGFHRRARRCPRAGRGRSALAHADPSNSGSPRLGSGREVAIVPLRRRRSDGLAPPVVPDRLRRPTPSADRQGHGHAPVRHRCR
jgi:hypothetical protein